MNLPVEVIKAVKEKQCVIFAGPGFARESTSLSGGEPSDDLSKAKAFGWKRPRQLMGTRNRRLMPSPSQAAESFSAQYGREEMLGVLKHHLSLDEVKPTPAHTHALKHFPLIITTAVDSLWEEEVSEHKSHELKYCGDTLDNINPDSPCIYHLLGCISNPESVVLTTSDIEKPMAAHIEKSLKTLLRRRVIFFVGYRPDEEHFENLWTVLSRIYGGELPRCHLAVAQGTIDDYLWQKWVWRGLLMFTADPTDCLKVLTESLVDE